MKTRKYLGQKMEMAKYILCLRYCKGRVNDTKSNATENIFGVKISVSNSFQNQIYI